MKIKSAHLSSPIQGSSKIKKEESEEKAEKERERRNRIKTLIKQNSRERDKLKANTYRDTGYIAIESIAGVEEINRILPARALKRGRQTIYTERVFTRGKAEEKGELPRVFRFP